MIRVIFYNIFEHVNQLLKCYFILEIQIFRDLCFYVGLIFFYGYLFELVRIIVRNTHIYKGDVAQMVERLLCMREDRDRHPASPMTQFYLLSW